MRADGTFGAFVSIRAPAWGATMLIWPDFTGFDVSIRAPAWGATCASPVCAGFVAFQFALPRGERRAASWHG